MNTQGKGKASHLTTTLIAGIIAGFVGASSQISYAILIFSGELTSFAPRGIGLFIFGSLIAIILTGLTSSYPGAISPNEGVPAAIIAVMASAIIATISTTSTPEAQYATVVAAIIITSLLTGVVFIFQGYFRLGALFRFLPYPVIGGFLAGLGWVLAVGGVASMLNAPLNVSQLSQFLQPDVLLLWAPGVLLAVGLLLILKRNNYYMVIPATIIGAVLLFYLAVGLLRVPFTQLIEQGWFLGPFSDVGLWQPVSLRALSDVRWSAIFAEAGSITALFIVSTISLLLSASGLELIVDQEIDLDQELQSSGLGTIGSGLVGGLVSYPALSLTTFGYQIGVSNRLFALVSASVFGLVLFIGPRILAWTPKFIFGGLLMYLGLTFLDEWVYKGWFKFSRLEYMIVITILIVIAAVGFLEGVALGVGLAIVLFVINYSQIDVVKHSLSGADYRSRVSRIRSHRDILEECGEQILVLQLQGFIFFGTANNIHSQIRRRLDSPSLKPLRFIVFDFQHVSGVDSTAIFSFIKMIKLAEKRGVTLIFSSPSQEHQSPNRDRSVNKLFAQFEAFDQLDSIQTVHIFAELDRALEWCENELLVTAGANMDDSHVSLASQLSVLLPDAAGLEQLLPYFERLDIDSGHYLIQQGDPSNDLYFIESGQVTAQLEYADRSPARLETMGGGTVVGEIGFYLDEPRTAAVVTDKPTIAFRLTQKTMEQMIRDDPEAAFSFHQGMIRLASIRIKQLITTVNALQR